MLTAMRDVDKRINAGLKTLVPINYGEGSHVKMSYAPKTHAPMIERMDVGKVLTGNDITPVVNVTEEDVENLKEVADKKELLNFESWALERYKPWESPVNKEAFNNMYPEFYERFKQADNEWFEAQKKLDRIRVGGGENWQDLYYLYRFEKDPEFKKRMGEIPGLKTGKIQESETKAAFQRGVMNAREWERVGENLGELVSQPFTTERKATTWRPLGEIGAFSYTKKDTE